VENVRARLEKGLRVYSRTMDVIEEERVLPKRLCGRLRAYNEDPSEAKAARILGAMRRPMMRGGANITTAGMILGYGTYGVVYKSPTNNNQVNKLTVLKKNRTLNLGIFIEPFKSMTTYAGAEVSKPTDDTFQLQDPTPLVLTADFQTKYDKILITGLTECSQDLNRYLSETDNVSKQAWGSESIETDPKTTRLIAVLKRLIEIGKTFATSQVSSSAPSRQLLGDINMGNFLVEKNTSTILIGDLEGYTDVTFEESKITLDIPSISYTISPWILRYKNPGLTREQYTTYVRSKISNKPELSRSIADLYKRFDEFGWGVTAMGKGGFAYIDEVMRRLESNEASEQGDLVSFLHSDLFSIAALFEEIRVMFQSQTERIPDLFVLMHVIVPMVQMCIMCCPEVTDPWGAVATYFNAYGYPGIVESGAFDAGFKIINVKAIAQNILGSQTPSGSAMSTTPANTPRDINARSSGNTMKIQGNSVWKVSDNLSPYTLATFIAISGIGNLTQYLSKTIEPSQPTPPKNSIGPFGIYEGDLGSKFYLLVDAIYNSQYKLNYFKTNVVDYLKAMTTAFGTEQPDRVMYIHGDIQLGNFLIRKKPDGGVDIKLHDYEMSATLNLRALDAAASLNNKSDVITIYQSNALHAHPLFLLLSLNVPDVLIQTEMKLKMVTGFMEGLLGPVTEIFYQNPFEAGGVFKQFCDSNDVKKKESLKKADQYGIGILLYEIRARLSEYSELFDKDFNSYIQTSLLEECKTLIFGSLGLGGVKGGKSSKKKVGGVSELERQVPRLDDLSAVENVGKPLNEPPRTLDKRTLDKPVSTLVNINHFPIDDDQTELACIPPSRMRSASDYEIGDKITDIANIAHLIPYDSFDAPWLREWMYVMEAEWKYCDKAGWSSGIMLNMTPILEDKLVEIPGVEYEEPGIDAEVEATQKRNINEKKTLPRTDGAFYTDIAADIGKYELRTSGGAARTAQRGGVKVKVDNVEVDVDLNKLQDLDNAHEQYLEELNQKPKQGEPVYNLATYLQYDLASRAIIEPCLENWVPKIMGAVNAVGTVLIGGVYAIQNPGFGLNWKKLAGDGELFTRKKSCLELYVFNNTPKINVELFKALEVLFPPDCYFKLDGGKKFPVQNGSCVILSGEFARIKGPFDVVQGELECEGRTIKRTLTVKGKSPVKLKIPGGYVLVIDKTLEVEVIKKKQETGFSIKLKPTSVEVLWYNWTFIKITIFKSSVPAVGLQWYTKDSYLTLKGLLAMHARLDAIPFNKDIERKLVTDSLENSTPGFKDIYSQIATDIKQSELWTDTMRDSTVKLCLNKATGCIDNLQNALYWQLQPYLFQFIIELDDALNSMGARAALGGGAVAALFDISSTSPIDDYDLTIYYGPEAIDQKQAIKNNIAGMMEVFMRQLPKSINVTLPATAPAPFTMPDQIPGASITPAATTDQTYPVSYQFRYSDPTVFHGVALFSLDMKVDIILNGKDTTQMFSFLDVVMPEPQTNLNYENDYIADWQVGLSKPVPISSLERIVYTLETMIIGSRFDKLHKDERRRQFIYALIHTINKNYVITKGTPNRPKTISNTKQYQLVNALTDSSCFKNRICVSLKQDDPKTYIQSPPVNTTPLPEKTQDKTPIPSLGIAALCNKQLRVVTGFFPTSPSSSPSTASSTPPG